jgi:HD-GYP domain-containing protein (c-di-GMP phosphodiesterase class II)
MNAAAAEALAVTMVESGYVGLVLDRLAKQASEVLATERSSIFVRDPEDPSLTIVAATNSPEDELVGSRVPKRAERLASRMSAEMPFGWDGVARGALSVRTTSPARRFSARELDVLATLGAISGAAVQHAEDRGDISRATCGQIGELAAMLDERDEYTAVHSLETAGIARKVGEALGESPAGLAELKLAAVLHDLGKIRVPRSILSKPGPLEQYERALINRHPVWGAELLACLPGFEVIAAIVRFHHERWDGKGYPDGLGGERIPLASRVIAACDAYHAMTSERPYRDTLSEDEALSEIWDNAGSQFDPTVVAALDAVLSGNTELAETARAR